MIRFNLISVFILLIPGICEAQERVRLDCIYTRSGNIYRGKITERDSASISILTGGHQVHKIQVSEIDSIGFDSRRRLIRLAKHRKGNGPFQVFELNGSATFFEEIGAGIGYYRGVKYRSGISLAGGLALTRRPVGNYDRYNFYRLSLTCRYDFPSKGDYPFLLFETGGQRAFAAPRFSRLFYYSAGVGYCLHGKSGRAFMLSCGWTQNMMRYVVYRGNSFPLIINQKQYFSDWYYVYDPFIKLGLKI